MVAEAADDYGYLTSTGLSLHQLRGRGRSKMHVMLGPAGGLNFPSRSVILHKRFLNVLFIITKPRKAVILASLLYILYIIYSGFSVVRQLGL